MFPRIRIAFGLALIAALMTLTTVFTKGNFSFITITSQNARATINVTDPALTDDFFAFADFVQDKTEAPTDPGIGYEVTRYYMDHGRETAFDHLHYYPRTGLVYYDGIVGGWSEYDGKWYIARCEVKMAFENVLARFSRCRHANRLISIHFVD